MAFFRIRPQLAIAALAAVALAVALGNWQLRRAAQKEAYQARIDTAMVAEPVAPAARDWPALTQELLLRRVAVSGHWLPEAVVYLDNRQHDGRPGFHVLMPLLLADAHDGRNAGKAILIVNRGWLPRDPMERTRIPLFSTPAGLVSLEGLVVADESRLLELGAAPPGRLGGIWQNFSFEKFSAALAAQSAAQSDLEPVRLILRQTSASTDGLVRDWQRERAMQSQIDRHHGYAFQWFALAALIAALTLFFGIRNARSTG